MRTALSRMLTIGLIAAFLFSIPGVPVAHGAIGAADFLKANGKVLRKNSGTGAVFNFRGTNLGGWLLQEGWMSPLGEAALDRAGWTATASNTSPYGDTPDKALDGNAGTRWSSGVAQANGQWFQVDMKAQRTFNQISFDAGSSTGDYPASYRIQGSNDGSSWWDITSGTGSGQYILVDHGDRTARYIRITQTGSKGNWWSIGEFNAYVSDDFSIRQKLNARFGTATADSLIAGYQDTWIQASDLDNIRNIGLNTVRVPIHWLVLMNENGTMKPDSVAFRKLDWIVSESAARNLYVILDLHGTPGAACPWQSCGQAGTNQLWTNATYQTWTVQIWERLATRYRGNAAVAGYDLLNEPLVSMGAAENATQVRQKFDFYNRLYQAVRAKDPDHLIIVAAFFDWEQALPPSTYGWTNVMYQTHHYNFSNFRDWNSTNAMIDTALQKMATYQNQWNVPIYAGEYWFWQHNDLYEKWLSGLNALNASWTNWSYKVKNADTSAGPDGVINGGNWGFYTTNTNPIPDINNDSSATIASKWSRFSTNYFVPNTSFQNLVRTYTAAGTWSTIQAVANTSYVSADLNQGGQLIANRPTASGWEKFLVVNNPDGTISLMSLANNKYVSADLNQGGRLVAKASGVLAWEKFRRVDLGNGTFALQALANNKYVSADLNQGAVLIASRDSVGGAWEAFVFATTTP
ncbi:MAG TPA: cellulase family glycosylhydrolase [Herpetosiphonaceae bacterium]